MFKKIVIPVMVALIIGCLASVALFVNAKERIITLQSTMKGYEKVNHRMDQEYRNKLTEWVYNNSQKISRNQVKFIVDETLKCNEPLFILAIMKPESEYHSSAVSSVGAKGLGQVMWKVWGKRLVETGICKEERDLFDPQVNIKAMNFIFTTLIVEHKHPVKALEAYVGGKERWYVNNVLVAFAELSLIK